MKPHREAIRDVLRQAADFAAMNGRKDLAASCSRSMDRLPTVDAERKREDILTEKKAS